ncbi:MAG: hypothetical protein ACLRSY_04710, partial [Acutalibacter sp.]
GISILLVQDRHSLPLDLPFPAKPAARMCVSVLHKRGPSRRSRARLAPREHPQFFASFFQERREKAPFVRKVRSLPAPFGGLGKEESLL